MPFEIPGRNTGFIHDMASSRPVIPLEAQTRDIDETLDEREATRDALKHTLGERAVNTDHFVPHTTTVDEAKLGFAGQRMTEVSLPEPDEEQQ